jgi:hypothetical protein
MAVSNLIEKKLDQPASKSKKAMYAGMAGLGVVVVFLFASFLILKHSEASKEIVELATTSIMAFMALAVTLITGQSAFDWKAVSALQHMSEDVKVDSNADAPEVQVNNFRTPKAKYYDTHDGLFS